MSLLRAYIRRSFVTTFALLALISFTSTLRAAEVAPKKFEPNWASLDARPTPA